MTTSKILKYILFSFFLTCTACHSGDSSQLAATLTAPSNNSSLASTTESSTDSGLSQIENPLFGYLAFVSTARGVALLGINSETGLLSFVSFSSEACPMVAVHPNSRLIYSACPQSNEIKVFTPNPATGQLALISSQNLNASQGSIWIDPSGRFMYVIHPDTSVSWLQINPINGELTPGQGSVPSCAYPVNMTFDHVHGFAYVSCYDSSAVAVYRINNTTGALTPIELASSCPQWCGASWAVMDPTGQYLYVSNQNANTVSMFKSNPQTGMLTYLGAVGTDSAPDTVSMDPSGQFVFTTNQTGNNISIFRVTSTGELTAVGSAPAGTNVGGFAIAGSLNFGYSTNYSDNQISIFKFDPTSGGLQPLFKFDLGPDPGAIATMRFQGLW